jgi:hypothetical protein
MVGQARSRRDQDEDRLCSVGSLSPDDYAQRAYWAALLFWWCPPIILLTFYHLIRAVIAQRSVPVENPRRFAWQMTSASGVGILVTGLLLWAIVS